MIDPRAIIDPTAKIASNVEIGPFTIIGPEVEIDEGTWIGPHTVIKGPTRIGKDNKIFQFASIGEDSQAIKYQGEKTWLEVGDRNIFREFCTVNRGNAQDGGITKIGNDNLFMAYVHVAHDCQIANHIIFANNASLAGHVRVDDHVVLSGFSGVHQFCHLFPYSFLASNALVVRDVPPYIRVAGMYAKPFGLNTVGLTRHGFSAETMLNLKRAYRIIYRQNLTTAEALKELPSLLEACPEVQLFIDALKNSERGIVR